MKKKARVIAFYLPQFHPIPENDEWWGKGFTEWTNVAKAKPLFKGHYQPHIPADLGFYDLRIPEVREEQAKMAKEAGVEGFCYWHYWFAGRRILERPINEMLATGKPDFPFCLGWANETWSGIWHGKTDKILIEQNYPGIDDYINHFNSNLIAFKDKRYIKINNKPIFYIYKPFQIPNPKEFLGIWNELAVKNGFEGIHFVANVINEKQIEDALQLGYNSVNTYWLRKAMLKVDKWQTNWNAIMYKLFNGRFRIPYFDYSAVMENFTDKLDENIKCYPTILTGWDNSPRSGSRGLILKNYTPEKFLRHLKFVLDKVSHKPFEERIIFMKSWNEWAEGNYVEPDLKYGHSFLEILKNNIYDK